MRDMGTATGPTFGRLLPTSTPSEPAHAAAAGLPKMALAVLPGGRGPRPLDAISSARGVMHSAAGPKRFPGLASPTRELAVGDSVQPASVVLSLRRRRPAPARSPWQAASEVQCERPHGLRGLPNPGLGPLAVASSIRLTLPASPRHPLRLYDLPQSCVRLPSLVDGATGDRPHRAPQHGTSLLRVPGSDAGGLGSRGLPAPGVGAAPVCSFLVFGAHPIARASKPSTPETAATLDQAGFPQPSALHPGFARLPSLADGAMKSRAGGPRGRLETPRMRLASAGPSAARTQGAALGGVKCKPEDTAARSVSAAAGGARGASRRPQDLGWLPTPAVGAVRISLLAVFGAHPSTAVSAPCLHLTGHPTTVPPDFPSPPLTSPPPVGRADRDFSSSCGLKLGWGGQGAEPSMLASRHPHDLHLHRSAWHQCGVRGDPAHNSQAAALSSA